MACGVLVVFFWQVSILQFFGTVGGALAGVVMDIFISDSPGAIAVVLPLWTFLCCLVRNNKYYGAAGTIAAFVFAAFLANRHACIRHMWWALLTR